MRRQLALAIALLAASGLAGAAQSQGETSSWVGRGDGPAEPAPKSQQKKTAPVKPGAVRIIKTVPDNPAAMPAPVAPPSASSHAKALPAGEDAAYEAFDQGKYLTALQLAVKAAERGDPQAHTLVGRIYADGYGTARNTALAAQWYARGAELGDPEAMFAYGVLLADGLGVEKNRVGAAQMFEAAAARRHPLANYNLALLFLHGDGKPENPHRASLHMQFAAEAGVAAAQYDLATLYATGTGVDANAFEAAKWMGKAAAAGHAEAQVDYAVMLFQGHGVPPDQKRGAELFRAAADKGLAVAQNRLARCYAHGAGVEINAVEASKWHLIAKAGGVADASLDKILARLSKADRALAQKAADDWRDRSQVGIE